MLRGNQNTGINGLDTLVKSIRMGFSHRFGQHNVIPAASPIETFENDKSALAETMIKSIRMAKLKVSPIS
jgi:hypothetical protein